MSSQKVANDYGVRMGKYVKKQEKLTIKTIKND